MSTRFHFPVLLCVLLMAGGCDEKVTVKDACGDGFVDPGEDCDGAALQGASCDSLGYYDRLAQLACAADCTFDVSACGHRCGDGTIEADEGEVCDGSNLAGQTCAAHGFSGGVLRCAADCSWDLTGCAGQCGNGMIEGAEVCDDGDGDPGDGCSAACAVEAGWECTTANPSVCAPICGDGLVVGPDECEGTDFGGRTCADFGYHAGSLVCLAGCVTDVSGCDGQCGDGELQAAHEDCDGAALGGATCASAGFYEGAVACAPDCTLDTSGCAFFCGDGQLQGAHGEDCDGTNLAGQDCEDFGLRPGTLACDASCAWDLAGCPGRCGDGEIQAAYEACDGVNLAGETCESRGHYPGTLRCAPDTCDFDTALCGGTCGDGWIAGMYGEECDGTELVGQTCENLGYLFLGELACTAGCRLDPLSCRQILGGDGAQHTCVALNDGTARCWGDNTYGSLGDGTTYDRTSPVTVGNLSNAVQVCTGSQFTCALTSDQTVKCWGRGPSGQFGDGTIGQRVLPGAFVSGLVGVTDLACGTEHVCAVTVDRIVWCWGRNAYGAIGDGTTTDALVPAQAFAITHDFTQVSAGYHFTCARLADGTAKCWGLGTYGQLGNGATADSTTPVPVSGLAGATRVGVGYYSACARLADGTVRCWGRNNFHQLGNGTSTDSSVPVTPTGLNAVTSLSVGWYHVCAARTDGSARCWGYNTSGQLGDGTTTNRSTPVTPSVAYVSGVFTGFSHTCALTDDDRSMKCWGSNGDGQLGDGTTTQRTLPVDVIYNP